MTDTPSDDLGAPLERIRTEAARMGYALVPREPTPDMRIAGGIAWVEALPSSGTYVDTADACYKAMVAIALRGGE